MLKLSAFFEINHGYQYAIAELTRPSPLETSLKLQLGRLYRVDHWVEPAFRDMMARPLPSISRIEAHRMGLDYYYILSHTKAMVEDNYWAIAYTEPNLMQPDGYKTPLQCTAVWKDEWWNGVAWQLLHPETPCRGDDLLDLLDKTDIPGLCSLCKEAILRRMKDLDVLKTDMVLQDIAVFEVMEFQTDEHIHLWQQSCEVLRTIRYGFFAHENQPNRCLLSNALPTNSRFVQMISCKDLVYGWV